MSASVFYCKRCDEYHRLKEKCPMFSQEDFGDVDPTGYDGPARMVPRVDRDVEAAMKVQTIMGDPDADVKNPKHYAQYKIEPITFIEENGIPYSEGNVIKYICRWRQKDGVRDLKKAREYIDLLIKREEESEHPLVRG